jgi:hypothetical protein
LEEPAIADDRQVITAGKTEAYEVIQHDDNSITIREIAHPERGIRILSGVRTSLIRILERVRG